jgi:Ca2+-binding EF-hand superfamily protein
MMIRFLYAWLLRLHPRRFRELFGQEMLSTFEEAAAERAVLPLFVDGIVSLFRQWTLRSEPRDPLAISRSCTHAIDGVPVFYLEEKTLPDPGSSLSGAAVSIFILIGACILVSRGGNAMKFYVPSAGLYHAPRGHVEKLPAAANLKMLSGGFDKPERRIDDSGPAGSDEHWALVTTRLPSPRPARDQEQEPFASEIARNYIQITRLLSALDEDGDGIISAPEIANAPAVLQKLDRNHDGKLTPEECGFRGLPPGIQFLTGRDAASAEQGRLFLERTRPAFMRFHPVIAVLDADHNGEISAEEIHYAARSLWALDRNRDGRITEEEFMPDPVENQLVLIFSRLDTNGDGRIGKSERIGPFAEHYRELLDRADVNHDGIVTEQELKDEIRRRADLNRDGVVTWEEMLRAQQSGAFGTFTRERR